MCGVKVKNLKSKIFYYILWVRLLVPSWQGILLFNIYNCVWFFLKGSSIYFLRNIFFNYYYFFFYNFINGKTTYMELHLSVVVVVVHAEAIVVGQDVQQLPLSLVHEDALVLPELLGASH